jgi:hypothetical protein
MRISSDRRILRLSQLAAPCAFLPGFFEVRRPSPNLTLTVERDPSARLERAAANKIEFN